MGELFPTQEDRLIGSVVAESYRVTGLLGSGAMGKVYRAEDVQRGTPVALKMLHGFLNTSKEAGARFRREAFVGVRLLHPNCVPVLDFGPAGDGAFYLAMELVEGESLGQLIDREGALPWRRAVHIARHVLRGLEHAHGESVVHRDIKPDNIFLSPTDGDPDFARILDFGIAKLVGDAAGHAITAAGISVGTPSYISPEQAMGGALDGRSDLYSLSIVLFEMLTGRTPFGDRDPMKRLLAHVTEPVPPFADIAPDISVPADVEALVRDGLEKKPEHRIQSASDYLARIEALLEVVPAPPVEEVRPPPAPPPAPPVVSRGPRRAPRVAIGVGIAIAVAVVIVAGVWRPWDGGSQVGVNAPTLPAARPAAAPISAEVTAALAALENGKTCKARRKAVARLQALGDPRAIPHLEKARSRPRGGKNANACLRTAADEAIEHLRKVDALE